MNLQRKFGENAWNVDKKMEIVGSGREKKVELSNQFKAFESKATIHWFADISKFNFEFKSHEISFANLSYALFCVSVLKFKLDHY